jgi:coenzyme F420-reducing hydrogenase delta subunit
MEHMGVEPGRIYFSWVSSAESTKFVQVANEITEVVMALGPNNHFIKKEAKAA